MRILSLLFSIWLSSTALWAQRVHLVFQDAPLPYVLGKIDEAFSDVHIHFIVDELADLSVSAAVDHADALSAIRTTLNDLPFNVRQVGKDIFIARHDVAEDAAARHQRDAIRSYRLDEVFVLEHLPILPDQENAAIILDIKGSELAHRGNAIDLLAYLPGLNVSQQQVTLHDSRTPVIYMVFWSVVLLSSIHYVQKRSVVSRCSRLQILPIPRRPVRSSEFLP